MTSQNLKQRPYPLIVEEERGEEKGRQTIERISFSACQFPSSIDFFTHALETIALTTLHHDIIYTDVPHDWGRDVFDYINGNGNGYRRTRKHYNVLTQTFWIQVISTEIDNCCQSWMKREMSHWLHDSMDLLSFEEFEHLRMGVGTTINFCYGPYMGSRQEPDCFIRPGYQQYLPTFVMVSAWSESLPQLREDVKLWMLGGKGDVRAILVLIWHHHQPRREQGQVSSADSVAGTAELYTFDTKATNLQPVLRQRESVFPAPASDQTEQLIRLTRGMLFGFTVFDGRNPGDVLCMDVERLREEARVALGLMGLEPAQCMMSTDEK